MALPKNELILSNFFSVSHFITPWKHQKNSWFSEIFIGYKKSKIWRNGPTDFSSAGFFSLIDFFFWNSYAEKYQEPTQTSKMELFAKKFHLRCLSVFWTHLCWLITFFFKPFSNDFNRLLHNVPKWSDTLKI